MYLFAYEVQVLSPTWQTMVQGEGVNASRLGPRDPKRWVEPWATCVVHGLPRLHGDKDDVAQVKRAYDDNSIRRPVRRERERLEGVKARREVGHASTSDRFDRFCLKIGDESHLGGLGLKIPSEASFRFGP